MSPFVFVGLSAIFGVCGQLLLKHGMSLIAQTPGGSMVVRMLTSSWVIGGLLVYGTGVIFWLLALSSFPISYVYPFASLSYIGIIVGSYFIFKEPMNRIRLMGIAMIIIGVVIAGLS